MNKIKVIVFLILIFLTCFQSCKSTQNINENVIYIMVYDFESKEINGVEIFVDNKKVGETDIYGRFIIPVDEKLNEIVFRKKNYEEIKVDINENREEFLYIKMGSSKYYAQMSEKYFDNKEYNEAKEYIKKALEIEERKDYLYLQSLIQKEMENEKSN